MITELILNNYKEPLKKVEGGYGYIGALSQTKDGEKLQCHVCGKLVGRLATHSYITHKMTARAYKEKFGLNSSTPLWSDKERERGKQAYIKLYASFSDKKKEEIKELRKEAWQEWWQEKGIKLHEQGIAGGTGVRGLSDEAKNKRGTCPDQLIQKVKVLSEILGRTPSQTEMQKYYSEKEGIDIRKVMGRTFKTYANLVKAAELRPFSRSLRSFGYSKEYLVQLLKDFHEQTGKIPTSTDMKAGDLPMASTYIRWFGSISNARQQAGLPLLVPNGHIQSKTPFQIIER